MPALDTLEALIETYRIPESPDPSASASGLWSNKYNGKRFVVVPISYTIHEHGMSSSPTRITMTIDQKPWNSDQFRTTNGPFEDKGFFGDNLNDFTQLERLLKGEPLRLPPLADDDPEIWDDTIKIPELVPVGITHMVESRDHWIEITLHTGR